MARVSLDSSIYLKQFFHQSSQPHSFFSPQVCYSKEPQELLNEERGANNELTLTFFEKAVGAGVSSDAVGAVVESTAGRRVGTPVGKKE